MNNSYKIFSGTNSRYLAEEMCKHLGIELGKMNTTRFSDGEFAVSFEESVRGCDVFLVQSTFPNSDNLMELLLMIDAAKRASAKVLLLWFLTSDGLVKTAMISHVFLSLLSLFPTCLLQQVLIV